MRTHLFRVYGVPTTQGSKRAFVHPHTGRAVVTEQMGQRLRDWRASVADAAGRYVSEHPHLAWPIIYPVRLELTFWLPRPKAHFSASGGIKDTWATARPHKKPDLEKLVRAVNDALSKTVIQNDALVVKLSAQKLYAEEDEPPGCWIQVEEWRP